MNLAPELLFHNGRFESGRAVVVSPPGVIAAIEDAAHHPEAVQLPGRALLPGLVNAHSHAFQRIFRGATENPAATTGNFWTWRDAMYRAAGDLDPQALYRVARMAFLEMALSGITTVGEFHYIHRDAAGHPYDDPNLIAKLMVRAAREAGLRICLLRAAYVRAGFHQTPHPAQKRFMEPSAAAFIANSEALRQSLDHRTAWAGIAPHSIRAVPLPYLREIVEWAQPAGIPIHMHVSEQTAEVEASLAEYGLTPVALLHREKILSDRFTAVHAIHVTGPEVAALAHARSFVCACPTTERNLGDGIFRTDDMLSAGVRVSLGSDSQAQIDLLEDARQLEYHLRLHKQQRALVSPAHLFRCATQSGAASLGVPAHAADFFTVDLRHPSIAGASPENLLAAIVFGAAQSAIRDVLVAGEFIVRDGRHPLAEEILDGFLKVPQ